MADDWTMGALAAQDAYRPVDNPWLPDVGEPAIGSGGQFSAGVPAVNRAADVMSRYPGHVLSGLASLPQRAFGASEEMRGGGDYDPGPALETALMTMGGGVAGTGPGGVAVGAGPIRAYHSSPHDFEKFDLSKIGTGEGAQMYGHGLYFAENPAVSGQGGQYWRQFQDRFSGPEAAAADALRVGKFDRVKAIDYLENGRWQQPEYMDTWDKAISLLKSDKPVGPRTYEVDINAEPSHFLDWDKKFSEQPQAIQDIIRSSGIHPEVPGPMGTKVPSDLPTGLLTGKRLQDPSSMLIKKLDAADIPGIKYLDEGSRGASPYNIIPRPRGDFIFKEKLYPDLASAQQAKAAADAAYEAERTRNYVVRNPALIDILRKYGIAGAAPAGMGALAAQDNYRGD